MTAARALTALVLAATTSLVVGTSTPIEATQPTPGPAVVDRAPPELVVEDLPPADPDAPALIATPGVNVPNPFVLVDEGRYYLYSSQVGFEEASIPLRISDDPRQWDVEPIDALPVLPEWAAHGLTWAPDVRRIDDGYVMYVTARLRDVEPRTQCIGVAEADRPEGPFTPAPDPLVCQLDRRGSIDPRSFVDAEGDLWLHWKSDDNADIEASTTASVYAQRLSPDGTTLQGEPSRILEADQAWEGRIVEAPHMIAMGGDHWLFYSGNWYNQPDYAIGLARCEGPAGPCTKPLDRPWLASNAQGSGPGEGSLFVDLDGALWFAYAPVAQQFETLTPRPVALARIGLGGDGPYPADPAADG